jgi:hypothetical protein
MSIRTRAWVSGIGRDAAILGTEREYKRTRAKVRSKALKG